MHAVEQGNLVSALNDTPRRWKLRYGAAALAVAGATLTRWLLDPLLGSDLPYFTFYFALLIAAWLGGLGPGLVCVLSGALVGNYLFESPRFAFSPMELIDQLDSFRFIAVGACVSLICEALHRQRRRADEQRELVRITLASIGDAVITTDPKARITFLNDVAEEVTGWTQAEARGKPLTEVFRIVNEETCEPVENPVQIALSEGRVVGLANHTVLIRKDGTERPIDDSAAPIYDRDRHMIGCVLIFRDISERRRLELQQAQSAERFRLAAEAVNGIIYELDLRTGHVERTRGLFEILGYHPHEVPPAASWWVEQIHPEDRARVTQVDLRSVRAGAAPVEYRVRHKDGRWLHVEDRAIVLCNDDGNPARLVGCTVDITERKRADAALAETAASLAQERARLDIALRTAKLGIYEWRVGSESIWWSPETYALYGVEPASFTPTIQTFQTLVHPDDRDELWRKTHESLASGELFTHEYRIVCQDGTNRWVLNQSRVIHDENRQPARITGVAMDITEQKRAQEETRRNEERLRTLANAIPQLAWMAHSDGWIHWYNQRWYDYTGTTPAEMEGWGWQRVHDPATLPAVLARWRASIETGEPFDMTFPLRGVDGRFRRFLTRVRPLKDEHGRVLQWFGTNTDVEELKQAEESLRQRAEEIETLLDVVPAAVWVAEDPQCLKITGNRRANEFYEAQEGENVAATSVREGRRFFDSNGRQLSPEELPMQVATATNQDVRDTVVYIENPSGRRFAMLGSAVPLRDAAGQVRGCIGAYMDITAAKQAEEQLKAAIISAERAKAVAERANQAKDQFLAMLSHELRTPLNPALVAATILERNPVLPAELREPVTMIRRNIELEARLIDDMLDLTRVARGKLLLARRIVDVCEVLRHAVATCQSAITDTRLTLNVRLPDEPIHVDADPARLQQVFWNLLQNSIKFTPAGGQISVTVTVTSRGAARVEVADTGKGIEREALQRIFDAFEQGGDGVTKHYGGLGLGLAICKGIIGLHGGTVCALSDGPGRGATFVVELPVAVHEPGRASDGQGAPHRVAAQSNASSHILLVDDHADTTVMMAALLRSFGHRVTTAGSVSEAFERLEAQTFDLLISDLGLPDGSGLDLVSRISARRPVKAIALSGYGMDTDVEASIQAGFLEHLTKPVNAQLLEAAINRALSRAGQQ